jgi:hypothetical protein
LEISADTEKITIILQGRGLSEELMAVAMAYVGSVVQSNSAGAAAGTR